MPGATSTKIQGRPMIDPTTAILLASRPLLSHESVPPMPRYPSSIAVPILASLSCLCCIPPLLIHARARNFATTVLVLGIIIPNLFNLVNSLLWPTDDTGAWWNGVGLCDVETKLYIGFATATVGAVACIFRQLAIILNTDETTLAPSRAQRRRRLALEIVLCIVVPVYLMLAHYLVQPARYYIFTITGCVPSFDKSWQSVVLVFMWPIVICSIAVTYSIVSIWRLIKYRREFSRILSSSQSTVSRSRFVRLFALATTLVIVFAPVAMYTFVQNASFHHSRYSWARIHGPGWSDKVILVPTYGAVSFDRWVQIGSGFVLFLFQGFGRDASAMYRGWLLRLGLARVFPSLQDPRITRDTGRRSSGRSPLVGKIESQSPQTTFDLSRIGGLNGGVSRHLSEANSWSLSISPTTLSPFEQPWRDNGGDGATIAARPPRSEQSTPPGRLGQPVGANPRTIPVFGDIGMTLVSSSKPSGGGGGERGPVSKIWSGSGASDDDLSDGPPDFPSMENHQIIKIKRDFKVIVENQH